MTLFTLLILAHLIGDFILQPNFMVAHKRKYVLGSYHLYIHSIIHGILALLLAGIEYWQGILFITITHLLIDGTKLLLEKAQTRRIFFFSDQLLHLGIILLVTIFYKPSTAQQLSSFFSIRDNLTLITCIVFLTMPVSVLIRMIISRWTPAIGYKSSSEEDDSLMSAGKYIGILERLFVFGFVISGHFEAVGFLLAAKSIFRFGDLKGANDRKLTEYVLIGTLISFGIAILTGCFYLSLMKP